MDLPIPERLLEYNAPAGFSCSKCGKTFQHDYDRALEHFYAHSCSLETPKRITLAAS